MAECKLNYTADEINKKLGEVADQVFDSESENAQSGIALKDLVIKELIAEDKAGVRFYIQDLEKGIYILKSLWTGTSTQRVYLSAGTTNLGAFGKGSVLIVNNNSTTTTATGTFRKAFLLIQGGLSDTAAVHVKSGTLLCTRIVDVDEAGNEVIDWKYDCSSGNILHSGDKTTTFNNDTDTSKIPTVGAVINYIDDLSSGEFYETIAEYTIESEEAEIYYLNKFADQSTLWLKAFYINVIIPTPLGVTPSLRVEINLGSSTASSYTAWNLSQRLGTIEENITNILRVNGKLENYLISLSTTLKNINSDYKVFNEAFPVDTSTFKGIRNISIQAIDGTNLPAGTIIKVLGVRA